jgi:hypothetical protein
MGASGMKLLRIMFFFGLVLVFVHRLIIAATPAWFDIFVVAYLVVVGVIAVLIAITKRETESRSQVNNKKEEGR